MTINFQETDRNLCSEVCLPNRSVVTRFNDPHMPNDFMEIVDLFRIVPVLTVANNIRSITRLYGLDNTGEMMKSIVKFCGPYVCQLICSYLKNIYSNSWAIEFKHRPKQLMATDVKELIHKTYTRFNN